LNCLSANLNASAERPSLAGLAAFGLTAFAGAFLLFLVQPLIARFILPWFGGSPAVWTTCMLFFQMLLLAGYAGAHLISTRLPLRRQVAVFLALLAVALLLLPIIPGDHWKPPDGAVPALRILLLLAACLGLPYLALSATAPLLQAWFSRVFPGVSPYRLYALSNAGSLLALVAYPLLVEPHLSRHAQAWAWSVGLLAFVLLVAWCGRFAWRASAAASNHAPPVALDENQAQPAASAGAAANRALWLALPACGVILLLAVTNKICQDIAVIPFLWVLPLGLYLLSFIVSFDNPRWYWRPFWLPLLAASLAGVLWVARRDPEMTIQIAVLVAAMFVSCMICHGELFRLRPGPAQLTSFYLAIAAGGALGGLFVAFGASLLFRDYHEFQLGFALVAWLLVAVLAADRSPWSVRARPIFGAVLLLLTAAGAAAGSLFLYRDARGTLTDVLESRRNFYGVLKVMRSSGGGSEFQVLELRHGNITHGIQYLAEEKRQTPCSYYVSSSGVGRLMDNFRKPGGRRVAVVGLGAGTMAAWGRADDFFRFYEINEAVEQIARAHFFYLADTAAKVEVAPGDARLTLERETDEGFDIIVLDAFSGDAIPVHLLTREAFAIYLRRLRPGGVIAVHISNRYLDLEPVVRLTAEHFNLRATLISDNGAGHEDEEFADGYDTENQYNSDWFLLSRNRQFLELPQIESVAKAAKPIPAGFQLWTDDRSSLLHVLVTETNGFWGRLFR